MKIIIADPCRSLGYFICKGLAAEGHEVQVRTNAEETLQVLRAFDFDLLIMELNLPWRDGLLLLQQLCAEGNRVRVIVLTERLRTRATDDLLRPWNVVEYITKPFSFGQLVIRVKELSTMSPLRALG